MDDDGGVFLLNRARRDPNNLAAYCDRQTGRPAKQNRMNAFISANRLHEIIAIASPRRNDQHMNEWKIYSSSVTISHDL